MTRKLATRIIAVLELTIVVCGVVFFVPAYIPGQRYIEAVLASGDINGIRSLVTSMSASIDAYVSFFVVCFSVMSLSAVLLLLPVRNKTRDSASL
jgi:hypothetical protein